MPLTIHAIVIHHRGREMLGECLKSLLSSEGVNLHIVLVLNGCDEELPQIVDHSHLVHPVRAPEPLGFSAANNLGVAWALDNLDSCSAWYFVNNDTVGESRALELMAAALEGDANIGVVGPQLLIQWAPDHLNSLGLNVTEDGWGWDEGIGVSLENYGTLPSRREVLAVTGSSLLIRSEVFEAIGGWTELYDYYFEDIDLCLKVRRAGWKVINEPEAIVYHAVSATTGLDSEWKVFLFWRNRLLLAFLHWPLSLLVREVLPIVIKNEILSQPWQDSRLQRRALISALRRLLRVLWLRRRIKGRNKSWVAMLRPPGSVPAISLPSAPEDRPPNSVGPAGEDCDPNPLNRGRGIDDSIGGAGSPAKETQGQAHLINRGNMGAFDTIEGHPCSSLKEDPESYQRMIDPKADGLERRSQVSKVLVLGVCPLPFESTTRSFGPGTRTWQLVKPLLDDGHTVTLIAQRIPGTYPEETAPEVVFNEGLFNYASVTQEVFAQTDYIRNAYQDLCPDAVVFAHGSASYFEHVLEPEVPVWIDLCGHVMAEAQAKAAVYQDDSYVDYFFNRSVGALFCGDHYSTVSNGQKFALIGELGLAGRLNAASDGHDLVSVIPCGAEEEDYPRGEPVFRGVDLDDDAFVVLWSGGFNTWTDVDTMFAGLEYAMRRDKSIFFVATGGQIDGHDEKTYPRFIDMVQHSDLRDRFVLKGWIDRDAVPTTYFEADVGINCEKDIYEVRMGSKHRILDWSRAALPVVSTRVTELSLAIEEQGIGFICAAGDAEGLGKAILDAAAHKDTIEEIGRQFRDVLRRQFGFDATTVDLRRWVMNPTFAPDRDREPLCLQRLLNRTRPGTVDPQVNPADSASKPEPDEGEFRGENRLQWVRRVVKKSYQDGGVSMVFQRMINRLPGRQ